MTGLAGYVVKEVTEKPQEWPDERYLDVVEHIRDAMEEMEKAAIILNRLGQQEWERAGQDAERPENDRALGAIRGLYERVNSWLSLDKQYELGTADRSEFPDRPQLD